MFQLFDFPSAPSTIFYRENSQMLREGSSFYFPLLGLMPLVFHPFYREFALRTYVEGWNIGQYHEKISALLNLIQRNRFVTTPGILSLPPGSLSIKIYSKARNPQVIIKVVSLALAIIIGMLLSGYIIELISESMVVEAIKIRSMLHFFMWPMAMVAGTVATFKGLPVLEGHFEKFIWPYEVESKTLKRMRVKNVKQLTERQRQQARKSLEIWPSAGEVRFEEGLDELKKYLEDRSQPKGWRYTFVALSEDNAVEGYVVFDEVQMGWMEIRQHISARRRGVFRKM